MLVVFYFLFFLWQYISNKKYKSSILNSVFLYYVAASLCAIITHYKLAPEYYHTIVSVFFHLLIFYIFLTPIIQYGKLENRRGFLLLDENRFKLLSYSLIGLQLFSIAFFAREDFAMLVRGDFSQIRAELLAQGRINGSIFRTVAGVASFYYCYNIILFFYSLSFRKDSKLFLMLLIVSSASRIFHSLTYMGRDGILFWILSFAMSYFIFKKYLGNDIKKFLRKIFIFIGGFAFLLLGAISLSRFSDSDIGVIYSLVDYFGQPINNFGIMFDRFHEYKGTINVLPLLYGQKGDTGGDVLASVDDFIAKYGFANNSFKSFVGSFYIAWGPFLTLIISYLFNKMMLVRIKCRKYISLPMIFCLMISIQIVIHNYFYWAYYIGVANLFLFTTPIFIIFCSKSNGQIAGIKPVTYHENSDYSLRS